MERRIHIDGTSHTEIVREGENVEIFARARTGEMNIDVRHEGANSRSSLIVAGVINAGQARVRMNLYAAPGLSEIEAKQEARIIILGSGSAVVEPLQDIRSADVIANHGAVISGVAAADIWRMALLGIERSEAVEILCDALVSTVEKHG